MIPKLDYINAVEYIYNTPRFTKKNKHTNTLAFMEKLGRPDRQFKVIHVAGTNGKGSVCAFLSNILVLSGRKTGLFTSPHLIKINERFQIDNVPVADEAFMLSFAIVKKVIDEMVEDGYLHPTFFEMLFGLAMVIFEKAGVEYVVLETGLGGRLDATNIVEQPLATVITSISYDHTEILGETLTLIAAEKAGIIKENVPVIYDARNEEVEEVIVGKAREMHASCYGFKEEIYKILMKTHKGIDFFMDSQYYKKVKVSLPFVADYQITNSILAMTTIAVLNESCFQKEGQPIAESLILRAVAATKCAGRMEMVLPGVIVDGAHNSEGIEEFIKTVNEFRNKEKLVLLFSAVKEKNYEKMIESICNKTQFDTIIVTEIQNNRAVKADVLSNIFKKYARTEIITEPDVSEAFERADAIKHNGILFCGGSLYLVGEVKDIIRRKHDD